MNRLHRMAFILLIAALALTALPAAAQQPPPNNPNNLPGCHDVRAISRYLGLSESQRTQWRTLRDAFRAAIRPLVEQIEPLHDSLEAELDKPAPSACTAGGFVVSIDGLRDQIDVKRTDYLEDFEALLTPAQLVKWDALQIVCQAQDKVPGIG